MRSAALALGFALAVAPAACGDDEPSAPAAATAPRPSSVAAGAPPAPRPPPLPSGSCCCETERRGDRLVQIVTEAACAETMGGTCAPPDRCWLPDPPQISGQARPPSVTAPPSVR